MSKASDLARLVTSGSTAIIDLLSYTAGGSTADADSATNITCGDLA